MGNTHSKWSINLYKILEARVLHCTTKSLWSPKPTTYSTTGTLKLALVFLVCVSMDNNQNADKVWQKPLNNLTTSNNCSINLYTRLSDDSWVLFLITEFGFCCIYYTYRSCRDNTMLIRPARGRFLSGIDSQVFLPMMTAFCLLESLVRLVIREKYAISFLLNKII